MGKIALSEMIEGLRKELQAAVEAGEGKDIRFGVGEVTVEAQVEVSKEAGIGGSFNFWIAELSADGSGAKTQTQKITLKLQPRDKHGELIETSR